MLTKKWIFVKEVKQVGDWTLQQFLNAYKKPTKASRFEAIRYMYETAMLRRALKRLAQTSQKREKKK